MKKKPALILACALFCACVFAGTTVGPLPTGVITSNASQPNSINNFTTASYPLIVSSLETTNQFLFENSFTRTSFTNGALGAATAFATYYTNTFGSRITVNFSVSFTDQVATASQVGMFQFTSSGVAEPPFYIGYPAGVATIATNYFTCELGWGEYVSWTNSIGTASAITNRVQF